MSITHAAAFRRRAVSAFAEKPAGTNRHDRGQRRPPRLARDRTRRTEGGLSASPWRGGAGTIVAFFCVLLDSTLIEPTDSHANRDQLRAAALHSGAMQAASWCEIVAGVLAP